MRLKPTYLVLGALFFTGMVIAQSSIVLHLDMEHPGSAVPEDFCGLSYEIKLVNPDTNGVHYFRASNTALVAVFKALGIKNLRVGGNTADRPTVPIPGEADIDSLFGFAKAAGVKVIYTVRLRDYTPEAAANICKYVMEHYKDDVSCITVGNEPNVYAKPYEEYRDLWKKYVDVIHSSEYAPDARFCGPSGTPGGVGYADAFAKDMAKTGLIAMITQHDYPGKGARDVKDPAVARHDMLSREWHTVYQKFYDRFVPSVLSNGLIYRMEEANSYYSGGAVGASDTYTSALWELDYMYWWAEHHAAGINFHTGEKVYPGGEAKPNVYTAISSSPQGYTVFPSGYAMKAFNIVGGGQLIPVSMVSNTDSLNMTAYAIQKTNQTIFITCINKEYGENGRSAQIAVDCEAEAQVMFLSAPNDDITTIEGVTFGGAKIQDNGQWEGSWTSLEPCLKKGKLSLALPKATAAVIRMKK